MPRMMLGHRLAGVILASVAWGGCAAPSETASHRVAIGGTSPLVEMFARVGDQTGIPPEILAALSYVQTRLEFVDSTEHGATRIGLYGMSPEDLRLGASLTGLTDEAARTDHEASIWIAAAHLRRMTQARTTHDILAALRPEVAAELRAVLVRGISSKDTHGDTVVVSARPELDANRGFGTSVHAIGNADYAPALWNAAHSGNYGVSNRTDIEYIVVHTVQGSYTSCINWFKDPAANVSAHFVVRSSDGQVTQMVKEKDTAWHDACFNTRSIGIEHEGYIANPTMWYTDAMYLASAKLTRYLADKYGIPLDRSRIQGHGETDDCSSHTDPGTGWNWTKYMDFVMTGGAPMLTASDVSVDAPDALHAGDRASVTVTIKNTGNVTWDLDMTRVGTQQPQDRESALFVPGDWMSPSRATGADGQVAPGETGTFTFDIVGPEVSEPTVFDEVFQLVHDEAMWFGPEIRVSVQVMPRAGAGNGMTPDDLGGCSAGGGAGSAGSACAMLAFGALVRRRSRERGDRQHRRM